MKEKLYVKFSNEKSEIQEAKWFTLDKQHINGSMVTQVKVLYF